MLGEVPSGWEARPLSDFLKESRVPGSDGRSASKLSVKLYGRGVVAKEARSVGSENTKYFVRRAGQLLYSRLDFLNGAFGLVPRHLDHRESTADLPAFDIDTRLDPFWLLSFLTQPSFYERQRGSAIGSRKACRIAPDEFLRMQVPIPPLPEQKKIAAILSSVDEAIQAAQAVINQTRRVKEGLLQDLLTRGIGHTRFKQTEIGEIPEGWEVRRLDEAVSPDRHVTYGIVQTGEHVPDGIPCVRVTDIVCDEIDVPQMIRTSNAISSSYGRTVLQAGDIMMALRGDIGHVRIVDDALVGCNLTRGVALIAPSNEFVPQYLLWALRSPGTRNDILRRVNGSALQEVPLGSLRQVLVACPPRSEQVTIADRMECAERAASSQKRVLDSLRRMKSGLLTDLLTGKVRVTP